MAVCPQCGASVSEGEVLNKLCSRVIAKQSSSWLQAVFTVPVDHLEDHEEYGVPELREVRALGAL